MCLCFDKKCHKLFSCFGLNSLQQHLLFYYYFWLFGCPCLKPFLFHKRQKLSIWQGSPFWGLLPQLHWWLLIRLHYLPLRWRYLSLWCNWATFQSQWKKKTVLSECVRILARLSPHPLSHEYWNREAILHNWTDTSLCFRESCLIGHADSYNDTVVAWIEEEIPWR